MYAQFREACLKGDLSGAMAAREGVEIDDILDHLSEAGGISSEVFSKPHLFNIAKYLVDEFELCGGHLMNEFELACQQKNFESLKWLLENVDFADDPEYFSGGNEDLIAVDQLCSSNHIEMAEYIMNKLDIDPYNAYLEAGSVTMKWLIERFDLDTTHCNGALLMHTCQKEDTEYIGWFIDRFKLSAGDFHFESNDAIAEACSTYSSNFDAVQFIIEKLDMTPEHICEEHRGRFSYGPLGPKSAALLSALSITDKTD